MATFYFSIRIRLAHRHVMCASSLITLEMKCQNAIAGIIVVVVVVVVVVSRGPPLRASPPGAEEGSIYYDILYNVMLYRISYYRSGPPRCGHDVRPMAMGSKSRPPAPAAASY